MPPDHRFSRRLGIRGPASTSARRTASPCDVEDALPASKIVDAGSAGELGGVGRLRPPRRRGRGLRGDDHPRRPLLARLRRALRRLAPVRGVRRGGGRGGGPSRDPLRAPGPVGVDRGGPGPPRGRVPGLRALRAHGPGAAAVAVLGGRRLAGQRRRAAGGTVAAQPGAHSASFPDAGPGCADGGPDRRGRRGLRALPRPGGVRPKPGTPVERRRHQSRLSVDRRGPARPGRGAARRTAGAGVARPCGVVDRHRGIRGRRLLSSSTR